MVKLYADEGFPMDVSKYLAELHYDVLTVQEAGKANVGIPDEEVLAYATFQARAVITLNRLDFMRLHKRMPNHAGIVVCSQDLNFVRLATRVNEKLADLKDLSGQLIRVYRPA